MRIALAQSRTLVALLLIACTSPLLAADTGELDALLARLARPAPSNIAFIERRTSALLAEPLLLRGTMSQPDRDTLVREVGSPYHEIARISAARVELTREGEPRREFSLRRAPELAVLLDSFRALLRGDRALLTRQFHFELKMHGEHFSLMLQPLDRRVQRRIGALHLFGHAGELLCLRIHAKQVSTLLLGAAAGADTPDFETPCRLPEG